MVMKPFIFCSLLVLILAGSPVCLQAQTNEAPIAPAAGATDREQATLEKHLKPIMAALNLTDADQATKVRAVLAAQLNALTAWHAQNDPQIKALWNEFNKARGKQNETNADAALAKLDDVYASFKPQHDKFISDLSALLTPEQVESVEDTLTINKVRITYNAYQQIFHGLTPEQNAFILKNLKAAREEAIDAGAMTEKSAFFKKYKIRIETYLTAQGYDVKQAYKDFVAKQKAEMAAKDAAGAAADDDKK
jgi:Spy/CpxP family protein refolding chaperone